MVCSSVGAFIARAVVRRRAMQRAVGVRRRRSPLLFTSSCGGSFSDVFCACVWPSCGLFFSFRLALLSWFIVNNTLTWGRLLLLDFLHEDLGGLERGDLVLGDDDGGVL